MLIYCEKYLKEIFHLKCLEGFTKQIYLLDLEFLFFDNSLGNLITFRGSFEFCFQFNSILENLGFKLIFFFMVAQKFCIC